MTEGNSTNTSTKDNICLSSPYHPPPFFFYKAGSTAFEYLYDPFHPLDDLSCFLKCVFWVEVKYMECPITSCLFSALIIHSCFDYHFYLGPLPRPRPGVGMCRSGSDRSKSTGNYESAFPEWSIHLFCSLSEPLYLAGFLKEAEPC